MDTDKNGTVSRTELAAKLAADDELQGLLKTRGSTRRCAARNSCAKPCCAFSSAPPHPLLFYVDVFEQNRFEQLDADGNSKITLAEFTAAATPTSRRPPRPNSRPR